MKNNITVFLLIGSTLACGGGRPSERERAAPKAAPEDCASYERELRACLTAFGAPATGADSFAATFSSQTDLARLEMEGTCARNRAQLRTACK